MSRRPSFAVVPVLAIALVVTACGSSSASSSASDAPESESPVASAAASAAESAAPSEAAAPEAGTDLSACEIVTADDIAAATGLDAAEIGEGEQTESPTSLSPGHTECDYTGEWGGVIVSLTPEDGANLYDAARGSYDDASDREVTGADGAFWSESNGRGFFWKGAVTVMMQIGFLAGGGDRDEIITALGQAAIDRVD
jgi:hypothetical protein